MKRASACAATLLAVLAAGCGETPAPTSPTSANAFLPVLSGPWLGSLQLSSAGGGECVGADLRASLGAGPVFDDGTVSISQNGTDVIATVRSIDTGSTCSYTGTMGINLFALSATGCDEKEIYVQCTNGNTRVLDFLSSTMNAVPNGGTATGVVATSYNVSSVDDSGNKKPVAGLTLQYRFDAARP